MFDFSDVHAALKDEQIRAWSVEQALDLIGRLPVHKTVPYQDAITISKMIEDYVKNGDVTGVIQTAVEEGYSEGRFEVKEAVEEWFSNIDLTDLFATKGWNTKSEGSD